MRPSHRSRNTLLELLRDTAMVRRRSRRGRIAASVVASVATLVLVTGMAPAYADDAGAGTDPAATATTATTDAAAAADTGTAATPTADPSPTTAPETTAPDTSAPADTTPTDTAPADTTPADAAPTDAGPADTTPADTSSTTKTTKKTSQTLASALSVLPLAAAAPASPDWIWRGGAAIQEDGEKDSTAYASGSAEDTNPATWQKGSADTPKADLLKYYLNVDNTDHVLVSFGFTRKSNNGDTAFAVELNQRANTTNSPPRPDRTVGDLLLKFHMDTSLDKFFFAHAYLWTAAADFGSYPLGCKPLYGGFGWCEISTAGSNFQGRTADDNFTAEGQVDLTLLFDNNHGCGGFFNAINLRGESSAENWSNSLQDYLETPGVTVPSTCASLVIKKFRAGTSTMLTGAHFNVFEGSTATGTPFLSDVYDGKAGVDTDTVAGQVTLGGIEPGTYTVVETQAPAGYFLPADAQQTLTVAKSGTATFSFADVKKWQALTVTKNGSGSYDAKYTWNIEKGVAGSPGTAFGDSLTKNVADDGDGTTSAPFTYRVKVSQVSRQTSDIAVSGHITVTNPNDEAVTVDLTDSLQGAECTVTGGATRAAQPGTNSFGYTCTYPDGTAPSSFDTTNVATASWDKSTYPQRASDIGAAGDYSATSGEVAISYTEHATDKSVTVTDDRHAFAASEVSAGTVDGAGAWTITWGDATSGVYTATYTRSISAAAGTCSSDTNTASLSTGQSADATAKVCVGKDLTVSKVSKESLTRTYSWLIDKTNTDDDPVFVTDHETGTVTTHWQVTVTPNGSQDKDWLMSGTITVSNPNDWEAVTLTGLTDSYTGGGSCTVDGWDTMSAADRTIPKGDSKDFDYTCVFDTKPAYDGTNTATATWSSSAASTPSGTDDYDLAIHTSDWTLDDTVNKTVTVTDAVVGGDGTVELGTADWSDGSKTFDYTVDLGSDPGTCTTWTNTAYLTGDGSAGTAGDDTELGNDSDTVKVCNAEALTLSKTAAGHFDRTYHWSLDKSVSADPSSDPSTWSDSATWSGDVYNHEFGYRVVLGQQPWTDDNFSITGTITMTNPNDATTGADIPAISSTITDQPDVGADATCYVDGGPDDGASLVGYQTPAIASGDDYAVDYRCTVADLTPAQYTGGENVVTATNASNSPARAGVTFTKAGETDKTVTVKDDMVDLETPATLGTVTYDEADPSKTYPFDYKLDHTAATTTCQGFTNHAGVFAADAPVLALLGGAVPLASASATATICPNPPHWTVSKTSDVGDGPVPVDSDITYTLTAHHVSGVPATDVVVTDDLSDLAPYVTLPEFDEPGVSYDAATHVLTWTIDELGATDASLDFTVHVNADAYGVDLPNLVTSEGSNNCPTEGVLADECSTDNDTPHYTLAKSSDAGETVMPPYLGAPGTTIKYTLTVHNDSDADINSTTMPGAQVTDDLSDVLDNATFDDASINAPDGGQATRSGNTLTWTLPAISAGGTATLSYSVTVNADQWDQTLTNTATPGLGGDCASEGGCTTTTDTPPATRMQVSKVNAETGEGLAGAEFTLYLDNTPLADPSDPTVGPEDTEIGTATSGDDGLAQFTPWLQQGTFLVKETKAPAGYDLPVTGDTMVRVVDGNNFVAGDYMAPFEFRDPAQGQLAIVAKEQFEKDPLTGLWVPSDGKVNYGDDVRYEVKVAATGPKLFHDVTVTDYLPGYNPADTTSTAKATLVAGSATCTGSLTCTISVDDATGLVTWKMGTVTNAAGAVEMTVHFPDLPDTIPYDANGEYTTTLWNVGYLAWDEAVSMVHHQLTSNEVVVSATTTEITEPPIVTPPVVTPPVVTPPQGAPPAAPTILPNTGGPAVWLPLTGLGLMVLGATLLLTRDRRRREA